MINDKWQRKYLLAKKYYELYGNLLIPTSYEIYDDGEFVKIGIWIHNQRVAYFSSNPSLTKERIKLLNEIGMIWDVKETIWYENYYLLKEYYEKHNTFVMHFNYTIKKDNNKYNIQRWLKKQRQLYKNGKLDEQKLRLLSKIDPNWHTSLDDEFTSSWYENYLIAKEYYEKYGNLSIAYDYVVYVNEKEVKLGLWVVRQRNLYRNKLLNKTQIDMLNKIGITWEVNKSWNEIYELVKEYYIKNGNLNIARSYYVVLGDEKVFLGTWIGTQRELYKKGKLEQYKIDLLEQIDMIWDAKKMRYYSKKHKKNIAKWYKKYLLAKEYYEVHGNLLIPYDYCANIGIEKINLGTWIIAQRKLHKKGELTETQIKLLDDIGMVWNLKEYNSINKFIKEEYEKYEEGLLEESDINKLLMGGYFKYNNDNEIVKGNTSTLVKKVAC